MLHLVLWI